MLQSRLDIEQTRLLVLNAAHQLDLHGNKVAKGAIAMAKVKHYLPIFFAKLWTTEFNLCFLYYLQSLVLLEQLFALHSQLLLKA